MPRRDDLHTIMILGSGPIVIGQAGEFDYSGTQGARALREEGYRVVLVNSNPATIMTDPSVADRTYVEPLDVVAVEAVIAHRAPRRAAADARRADRPQPGDGPDAARGARRYGVELIGADVGAIRRAEDREVFRDTMAAAGLATPASHVVTDIEAGRAAAAALGLPVILRPGFTLGGEGGGAAHTPEELERRLEEALAASPIGQVLVEQSVLGWAEIELEVVRDVADNAVIVCSIENIDPMGVHTGDSVTVAPVMTLTDQELQGLRDAAIAVIRAVGVSTGGANVQFALNRETGEIVVIEMNPRVSRSSALASKATGFPIAKIAARLAVGLHPRRAAQRDHRRHAGQLRAHPRLRRGQDPALRVREGARRLAELTTHMKSVGEVLALGRTFGEAFGKAMAGRELDVAPRAPRDAARGARDAAHTLLGPVRHRAVGAGARGQRREAMHAATCIDPWFLDRARPARRGPRRPVAARWTPSTRTRCARARRAGPRRPRHRRGGRRDRARGGAPAARARACGPPTTRWTPAPPSSPPSRPTTTRRSRARTSWPATTASRSWCSARAPTASARASSSTTAASTPPRPRASSATPR